MSLYSEIEVDASTWQACTEPLVEAGSFLRGRGKSGLKSPVGDVVTIVLRGLQAQHENLNEKLREQQPWVTMERMALPSWWSIHHWAQQELAPNTGGFRTGMRRGRSPPHFAPVEVCKVTAVSWHRRLIQGMSTDAASKDGWFVRLRMQRCKAQPLPRSTNGARRSGRQPFEVITTEPWMSSLEFHLDAEKEFIIPRGRYVSSVLRSNWKPGDPCHMMWAGTDEEGRDGFEWWEGKVLGKASFDPSQLDLWDPWHRSPWEQLEIFWKVDEPTTRVSAWEIHRHPGPMRSQRLTAGSSDEDFRADVDDGAGDEEYEDAWEPKPDSEDEGRRHPRAQGRGRRLAGEVQGGSGLGQGDGSQRPRRAAPPRRQQQGRGGWRRQPLPPAQPRHPPNAPFCDVCMDGGQLLPCAGSCYNSFHLDCLPADARSAWDQPGWLCPNCRAGETICYVCSGVGSSSTPGAPQKCSVGGCGLHYHPSCLQALAPGVTALTLQPQARLTPVPLALACLPQLVCPAHFCQTCAAREERRNLQRCWLCPRAYHDREGCMPQQAEKLQPGGSSGGGGGGGWIWCPSCLQAHREKYHDQMLQQVQVRAEGSEKLDQGPRCSPEGLKARARSYLRHPPRLTAANTPGLDLAASASTSGSQLVSSSPLIPMQPQTLHILTRQPTHTQPPSAQARGSQPPAAQPRAQPLPLQISSSQAPAGADPSPPRPDIACGSGANGKRGRTPMGHRTQPAPSSPELPHSGSRDGSDQQQAAQPKRPRHAAAPVVGPVHGRGSVSEEPPREGPASRSPVVVELLWSDSSACEEPMSDSATAQSSSEDSECEP